MVKIRLIPVLYIKNGLIVRSEDFSCHQNIGNVINEASRYNDWDVDELIYIDISRENHYDLRRDDHKIKSADCFVQVIQDISKVCFMPLTFGGGIRNIDDVDLRIQNGADKVTLNTGAYDNPELIRSVAMKYGAQCVVMSIDYRIVNGCPHVFTRFGEHDTGTSVIDWVKECEFLGVGEVFLNAIEHDGKADGYDLETIGTVVESTRLPIIACGGAGDMNDFLHLARSSKVSAIAAGNIFHFTERSYPRSKQFLKKHGINVR